MLVAGGESVGRGIVGGMVGMEQGGSGVRVSRRVKNVPVLLVVIPSAVVVLAALLLDGLGIASKALVFGVLLATVLPTAALVRAGRSGDGD